MADHMRAQIRHALVARLTGLATTGANAYASVVYAQETHKLPALLVATLGETSETLTLGAPRRQDRRCRYRISAVVRLSDPAAVEDELDQICKEAEAVLAMPGNQVPAKTLSLLSTEIGLQSNASKPVGVAVMTYEATYQTAENAPDIPR